MPRNRVVALALVGAVSRLVSTPWRPSVAMSGDVARMSACATLLCLFASLANAQPSPDMQRILERLDRIEAQNRELLSEVQALRQQLDAVQPTAAAESAAPIAERLDVDDHRIAQQEQEKISSEHRLPITLTGMVLFNSFWTGQGAGGADNPTVAALTRGPVDAGGTFRQSVVGVKFDGPTIVGGGKISGSAYVDFFGGTGRNAQSDAAAAGCIRGCGVEKHHVEFRFGQTHPCSQGTGLLGSGGRLASDGGGKSVVVAAAGARGAAVRIRRASRPARAVGRLSNLRRRHRTVDRISAGCGRSPARACRAASNSGAPAARTGESKSPPDFT